MKHLRSAILVFVISFNAILAFAEYIPTTIVSANGSSVLGNGVSSQGVSSGDHAYSAFVSVATNLVSGDNNGASDIFQKKISDASIVLVSVSSAGVIGNGASSEPSISSNGRYIAFSSLATNLDVSSVDSNGVSDIFLRDTISETTVRLSHNSSGTQGNAGSFAPAISADGRYVAFESDATNLVSADTNGKRDIFVYDTVGDTISRISVNSSGSAANNNNYAPSISGNGNLIVFESDATNLDLIASDVNARRDIYLHNVSAQTTIRISLSSSFSGSDGDPSNGDSANAVINVDGTIAAFESDATNLLSGDSNSSIDIFVRNLSSKATTRASVNSNDSQGNSDSLNPALSASGRYICFESDSSNLDSNNVDGNEATDIFIRDLTSGDTSRVSATSNGASLNGASTGCSIAEDGSYVAFTSAATNLISSDRNSSSDVFHSKTTCAVGITDNTDTDGDSTIDCSDGCVNDSSKISAGQCGCGSADTDTDSDGTANCLDLCPTDASKVVVGICGCGTSDADLNSNALPDCADPTILTIPSKPTKSVRSSRITVNIPRIYSGVTYILTIKKGSKTVVTKVLPETKTEYTSRKLSRGTYTIQYTITLAGVTTLPSNKVTVRIK